MKRIENRTISNSTPLITLSKIRCLHILKSLFGTVVITQGVYQETAEHPHVPPAQRQMIQQAIAAGYIAVEPISVAYPLRRSLGSGERETISLALERPLNHLILDDKNARKEAVEQGLGDILINTATVLKKADARGLINYTTAIQELKAKGEILSEET